VSSPSICLSVCSAQTPNSITERHRKTKFGVNVEGSSNRCANFQLKRSKVKVGGWPHDMPLVGQHIFVVGWESLYLRQGAAMPGRRLAQMAAALKTCITLHEAGELDDRLQPVGKELIKYDDEDCEWEEHELHGQARPGTTKRKQYYNKKVIIIIIIIIIIVIIIVIVRSSSYFLCKVLLLYNYFTVVLLLILSAGLGVIIS